MRTTVMGHAGLYVEAAGERILLDPVLRTSALGSGAFNHTYPRKLSLDRMPEPTILAITHAHTDHLDPKSLAKIARDIQVVAPDDPHTLEELHTLGFTKVAKLDAWQTWARGGLRITATPTDSGVDEVGYLFEADGARFWHMSDAEATPETGQKIRRDYGRTEVVAAKYQPTTRVMARLFRSLGPAFDKREVIEWLEAAAETEPKLIFPYASGLSFLGRYAWLNRYLFPYRAEEIVELLDQRLAGSGRAEHLYPGDVVEISEGSAKVERQASPFVKHKGKAEPPVDWEPIDTGHFRPIKAKRDRTELTRRLDELMRGPWVRWIRDQLRDSESAGYGLFELGVAWQLVVHLDRKHRIYWGLDFTQRPLSLIPDRLPRANYAVHMSGKSLLEVLRGEAGSELLYACGDALIFEKIMSVRDGKIWAPPLEGINLYSRLPDPLTFYLRWQAPKDGVIREGGM